MERIKKTRKYLFLTLSFLLILESFVAKNSPIFSLKSYPHKHFPDGSQLIDSNNIDKTLNEYRVCNFVKNTSSSRCYEPSFSSPLIQGFGRKNYKSEVYLLSEPQNGTVSLSSYTPGKIELDYDMKSPSEIELNTNALYGWYVDKGSATISGQGNQLLRVVPKNLSGHVSLKYWPRYLTLLLILYVLGWIILGIVIYKCFRVQKEVFLVQYPVQV